jgi:hypothetical protein
VPDLETWANLAEISSLAAIVIAASFAVYQLRADRRVRQDAAAFAVIQNFMDDVTFLEAARFLMNQPPDWHERPLSKEAQGHVDRVFMTMETIGFAVYRGVVRTEDVESFMGGIARQMWKAVEPLANKERVAFPRWYEWTEWLAARLEDARPGGGLSSPVALAARPPAGRDG